MIRSIAILSTLFLIGCGGAIKPEELKQCTDSWTTCMDNRDEPPENFDDAVGWKEDFNALPEEYLPDVIPEDAIIDLIDRGLDRLQDAQQKCVLDFTEYSCRMLVQ